MDPTTFGSAEGAAATVVLPDQDAPCNLMSVENLCDHRIELRKYYTYHGKAEKVFPDTIEPGQKEDAYFTKHSEFATKGCSGIVTFKLDEHTWLHILWDCPWCFRFYDNFIALYLCRDKNVQVSRELFYKMEQKMQNAGIKPKKDSPYDLVCCGPGKGTFLGLVGNAPKMNWGWKRPCKVHNGRYKVTMTMGESHNTTSTVIVERISS